MTTGGKIALVLALAVAGAVGVEIYEKRKAKAAASPGSSSADLQIVLKPGAMDSVGLSAADTFTVAPPAQVVDANQPNQGASQQPAPPILSSSNTGVVSTSGSTATAVSTGSATVKVVWVDGTGAAQTSTIPVVVS